MEPTPAHEAHEPVPKPRTALPEATIAGDWTFLAAIAAAVAALLFWRRRTRGSSRSSH